MQNLKLIAVLSSLSSILLLSCNVKRTREEPPYPTGITGWEGKKNNSGEVNRYFVLKSGEATDNGQIQVRVIEIYPTEIWSESGSVRRMARARILVVRLSDNKVLCDDVYPEKGGAILSPQSCHCKSSDFELLRMNNIETFSNISINVKEGWVSFSMNGS